MLMYQKIGSLIGGIALYNNLKGWPIDYSEL
jgi:hypothetical protein